MTDRTFIDFGNLLIERATVPCDSDGMPLDVAIAARHSVTGLLITIFGLRLFFADRETLTYHPYPLL